MEHIHGSTLATYLYIRDFNHPFEDYAYNRYADLWSLVKHAGLEATDLHYQLVICPEIYSIGSCISFIYENEWWYDWLENVAKLQPIEIWRFANILLSVGRCRSYANFNELAVAAKKREAELKQSLFELQDSVQKFKAAHELQSLLFGDFARQYNEVQSYIDEAVLQLNCETGNWVPRTPLFAARAYLMMCCRM